MKRQWFYSIGLKKYPKSRGLTDLATENVEKTLVLQTQPPTSLKNKWFYKQRDRKQLKNSFTVKPVPATASHRRATDSGSETAILALEAL